MIKASIYEVTGEETKFIGILKNKSKIIYKSNPGKHTFMGVSEAADFMEANIVEGKTPSTKVFEDENVVAFNDISKEAPVHILVIPKEHIDSFMGLDTTHKDILNAIRSCIQSVAKEQNIDTSGFRIVTNIGDQGGQTVNHLHFHVLGGRSLTWPPG